MKSRNPLALYIPGHQMVKYIGRHQWLYRRLSDGALVTVSY